MDSQPSSSTTPVPILQTTISTPSSSQQQPKTVKIRRQRQPKTDTTSSSKKETIKIKLTAKSTANAPNHIEHGGGGNGSEEEDDPETAIEEHMIFRVPPGELCDKLHEVAKKREFPDDVKLNFKETRKGQFFFDNKRYDVALVDLPTIIESQKTLDKKQFYKVADISQMVLVDPTSGNEPFIPQPNVRHETDPYSFPHGLTPPLKHVRQRRFRKKLSKRAIEEVEKEVERLLEVDATAEDVQYEVVDNRDMDQMSDTGTQQDQDQYVDMEEYGEESESDEEFAAELEQGLFSQPGEEGEEEEDDEDEDESGSEEEEEEDDEEEDDDAQTGEIEQKKQEIAELKLAIKKKTDDLASAPNDILKKRFENEINNLKKSLNLKEVHLQELKDNNSK